jgi:PKD repeat protein
MRTRTCSVVVSVGLLLLAPLGCDGGSQTSDGGARQDAAVSGDGSSNTGDGSSVGVAPTADFYGTPLVGQAPLMTDFISTSTGTRPMTFEWDFNNTGYIGSTDEHPPIGAGYLGVGYHSVALTVTNAYGSDKMVKIDYVNVLPPAEGAPVADFIASPTTGAPPLTVQFTDTSTGSPASWAWSFGDGGTSTLQSPSHVYATVGTYAVSLVATNANGSNTMTKSGFIVISTGGGETYGAEEGNDTGSPIGGGAGYQHIVTSGDFTVRTLEELKTALGAAQPFDVIFIPGDVTIDIAGESSALVIPPEVTLASNRGYDAGPGASLGGRILRSSNDAMDTGWSRLASLSPSGNGVRITGLRIEGADDSYTYVYPENQITGAIWTSATITNLEVDNCEIYHWSYAAVSCFGCGHSMHIHHCSIHNIGGNTEIGYGYGCASAGHEGGCGGGWMLVEANLFNYVRHAVMSSGYPGDGYEARFNIHGTHNSDTTYDVHASGSHMGDWDGTPSGRLFNVHHNTAPSPVDGDQFMGYVAPPSEAMNVYNNRMGNGVYCPHGYDRLNMTSNYIGGVFHASGQ